MGPFPAGPGGIVGVTPLPIAAAATAAAGFDHWLEFFALVLVLLAFDLLVIHRRAHVIPFREALFWSFFWILLALAFNGWVWWEFGRTLGSEQGQRLASEFFAAWLTEKSLSVDNLFVFVVLFNFFKVPAEYRHRVLFFGILGALVMRGLFIFAGVELLKAWEPFFVIFGGLLLFTAWKLLRSGGPAIDPERTLFYRIGRRVLPLVPRYEEGRFFTKEAGRTCGTTLLLALFVVEGTDVIFALDSVPACIGISQDLFIVYTSNVFAILGLRALFFLLQGVLEGIPGLQAGLSLVLAFVGVKMILAPKKILDLHIDPRLSMGIILGLLVGSWAVGALLRRRERSKERDAA
jgi:tellurite resistance protein TerC